jgi:hypothetical protein
MTAWQDEPPLTRRQIRERERGGRAVTPAQKTEETAETAVPRPGWETDARSPETGPVELAGHADTATGEHQLTRRELRAQRQNGSAPDDSALHDDSAPHDDDAPHVIRHDVPLEVQQQAEPAPLPVPDVSADFAQIIASPSIDTTAIPVIPSFPVPEQPAGATAQPGVYTPPFGHWSMQAKIDDENQTLDHSVRRDLSTSSGTITTSALVLPSIPRIGDVTRPISNTGEILVTGSIDLPRSLGTTGSYPTHFDRSDVDAIIAADDREDSVADSAPVRAIRAVSTNNDSPALVADGAAKESRTPFVLAIIAAATLVVTVALVIAGFIFNVF